MVVEEIIQKLTSIKSVSVVYLVAKVEVGSQLITSYTKGGKKKVKKDLKISFESNIVNGSCMDGTELSTQSSTQEIDPTTFLTNGPDTPEKTAEDIYNSLKIESSAEILLCIAWCNDKQWQLLALFPEALTTDMIFKMNNKKQPLYHICGKTSNETFGGLYAFLPSQANWVFDYM
jgi:hypothetical protein